MKNNIKFTFVSVCILSSLILCSCEESSETRKEYDNTKGNVLGILVEKDMEKRTDEAVNFDTKDKNEYNIEQIKVKSAKALSGIAILNDKDRKSTRLNSSHANISYAVFCLKKKKK